MSLEASEVKNSLKLALEPSRAKALSFFFELVEVTGHQMHVLQHDPETFTVTSIKLVVGELVLTLAEGDGVEHLLGVEALGSSEELDVLDVGSHQETR